MKKSLFTTLAILFLMGANCSKAPPHLSSQLDHVSALAMVNCDTYLVQPGETPLSQRTCLVVANPLRPFMRAFDLSQNQFLLSPMGFSPLAVRANGLTTQLASYSTSTQGTVFSYDANLAQLLAIDARNNGTQPSFSGVAPHPVKNLDKRPLKIAVANPSGPAPAQILTFNMDGSVESMTYDDSTKQFSTLQQISGPKTGEVVDVVFDAITGVYAVLLSETVNNIVTNSVFLKQIVGASGTPPESTIDNVANVRLGLGQLNTSTAPAPHLFLMSRDNPTLRTARLDAATLQIDSTGDNTITLKNVLTAIYVPSGDKEQCCAGITEWISASSDDGQVYYLTRNVLQSHAPITLDPSLSLSKLLRSGTLSGLVQIVGGDVTLLSGSEAPRGVTVCERQVFYAFSPGFVVSTCEGDATSATLVVSRDIMEGP